MKKLFALILALVMTLSLAACGAGNDDKNPSGSEGSTPPSSQQGEQNTPDEGKDDDGAQTAGWPTEGYGALIPEPDWGFEIVVDNELQFVANFDGDRSQDELDAYKEKLMEAGFDTNVYESGTGDIWNWDAVNDDNDEWISVRLTDGGVRVKPKS